jgi:peptidoglycan/LPS O-acetylase OafA/YrhL
MPAIPAPGTVQPSTLVLFLLYLNENAWTSVRWLSNGPMWSIAYEFWYYIGFAVVRFATARWRWPLLLLVAVAAGWKILLLLPVWLLGVWIYGSRDRLRAIGATPQTIVAVAALVVLTLWCTPAGYAWTAPLRTAGAVFGPGYQAMFVSDYLQGLLVAVILVSAVRGTLPYPAAVAGRITHAAGMTFSLYMFHVPLILLFRSLRWYDSSQVAQSLLAAGVSLAACYGLSRVTERRKDLWHDAIAALRKRSGPASG